jgi:hypothetical protein
MDVVEEEKKKEEERILKELGPEWSRAVSEEYKDNYFNVLSGAKGLLELKQALEKDGLYMKKFIDAGLTALVFEPEDMPGIVARVDHTLIQDSLKNPIILDALDGFDKTYRITNKSIAEKKKNNPDFKPAHEDKDNVRVRLVLEAELADPKNAVEDMLRTAAVMKHLGGIGPFDDKDKPEENKCHWLDVKDKQLFYLKRPDGSYLTYPSDGKKITYIGDLNSVPAHLDKHPQLSGFPNVQEFLAYIKLNKEPQEIDALIDAVHVSKEDLDACQGKYALAEAIKRRNAQRQPAADSPSARGYGLR